MTKEVFELVRKMDIKAVETQMALRCAPFIAGLKTSNLLIVKNEQAIIVWRLLRNTKFDGFLLYKGNQKSVFLLYTSSQLKAYLEQTEARKILFQEGYLDISLQELLSVFSVRYRAYMQGNRKFPHEMGLFLGYPPEDVRGFMENEGQNSLCTGYWKVYENVVEKICLFQKFDQARESLLRLMADGISMADVLRYS